MKRLVELHRGTVWVRSPGEHQGTTVTVHLPLMVIHRNVETGERQHPKTANVGTTSFIATELTGLKVLVVDDQSDARNLIKRVLEDCAAEVITAGTVDEALETHRSRAAGRPRERHRHAGRRRVRAAQESTSRSERIEAEGFLRSH